MNPAKREEIIAYAALLGYVFRRVDRMGYVDWWAIGPDMGIVEWAKNRSYLGSIMKPQPLDALLDKIGIHHGLL